MLSKTQIVLTRSLVLGLAMAYPSCVAAQLLDRGAADKPVKKTHKEWTLSGMGELAAHDGADLDFVAYTNRDGIGLTIIRGTFDSEKQSAAELNDRIKNAKKVIEHSLCKGESGKTVGERVVVVFQETTSKTDLYGVLWTKGADFTEVVSPSLSLALEVEKKRSQPSAKAKPSTVSE